MSNLLQKASIITTPTAYDTGKILSVKPVETYGPELITNGDFATNSDWNSGPGWSISGGAANASNSISYNRITQAGAPITTTTLYKLTFTVFVISGGIVPIVGSKLGSPISVSGTYTQYLTSTATTTLIQIASNPSFTGSIDNVSVKEVLNADFDFTRNSSATRVGSNGLIQDVASNLPRIDYTGGVGSWKFEPQRTNLLPYSEDFTNWSVTNATLTENATISPDGTLNATKITDNATSGNHRVITPTTTPTSGNATYSIFLKKGTMTTCFINMFSGGTIANTFVDLENGTISGGSGLSQTIEPYGNDWYRVSITGVLANSSTYVYVYVKQIGGYVGAEDHIFMYGAQLEVGSYPTSYIRSNSGSATTRLADVANNAGSSDLINSTEGVLYAEISALADDNNYRVIAISDGNTSNRVVIDYSNTNKLRAFYAVNNILSAFFDIDYDIKQSSKILIKYKVNDFQFWVNGFKLGSDNSGAVLTGNTLNTLNFNFGGSSGGEFYGNTKCVAVFKEALTDLELECLVSWMSFSDLGINFGYTVE